MNKLIFYLLIITSYVLSQTTPVITKQPQDQIVEFGQTASFSVSATSTGTLGYQWWRVPYVSEAESKIVGANTNTFRILNTTNEDDQTQYLCEVKNLDGYPENEFWINSDTVGLTVIPSEKKIIIITNPSKLSFIQEFKSDTTISIEWISNNIEYINIEYSVDGGNSWIQIVNGLNASIKKYDWKVPNTPSIFCKLKISESNNKEVFEIFPFRSSWEDDLAHFFIISGVNRWKMLENITDQNLTDIKFSDKNNGIIWGNNNILKTENGGDSWEELYDFTWRNLTDVNFISKTIGYGFSDKNIYKTIDGGRSWHPIYSHNLSDEISNMFFLDEINGWFISLQSDYYKLYRTDDGGITWQLIYQLDDLFDDHHIINTSEISFISETVGFIRLSLYYKYTNDFKKDKHDAITHYYTFNKLIKTNDGGKTWVDIGSYIESYSYINETQGGTISQPNESYWGSISPINDEISFTHQYSSWVFGYFLNKIHFYDENIGWFSGNIKDAINENIDGKLIISTTTNGGENWILQSFDFKDKNSKITLNNIYSYDGGTCWAVGDNGTILKYGEVNTSPENWTRTLTVKDNLSNSIVVSFGQSFNATNSIDNNIGEKELPPLPPQGAFDTRFILDDNSSTLLDLRNSEEIEITWTLQFQPSSSGYPIVLKWNKDYLPFGSFFLKDVITGTIINVDMKLNDSLIVTNESINKLQIKYKEQCSSTIVNSTNWDLLSIPLATENMNVGSIFPNNEAQVIKFENNYKNTEILENGVGYWVKFAEKGITNVYGEEINVPIPVKKGWNIIGPYNKELSIDKIQTTPPGIVTSDYYGFKNGYFIADKIEVWKGYWIKVNQDGEITFADTSPLGKESFIKEPDTEPSISFDIIAYDGVSDSIKLTFGLDSLATNGYNPLLGEKELPPLPPLGVFDARLEIPDTLITSYSDYRPLAVACYEYKISYQLGDSSLGLTLSWNLPEGVTLILSDMFGGSIFNIYADAGEGSYTIGNTEINNAKLTLCYSNLIVAQHEKDLIPDDYSLLQNYPNPFNPTTRIQFALPRESRISLIIYNILGQKVTELVNQQLKAGYHEVEFNSSQYTSGIYIYRLQANEFVETKKMIFLK